MIIVLGSVCAIPRHIERARALSLQHVLRSRSEDGCVSHDVSTDVEDHTKFVFVEQWDSLEALKAHFALKSSREFVSALRELTVGEPVMRILRAETL